MEGRQKDNYAKRKSKVLATVVVASTLALFICGIVSFKFIKKRRKGQQSTKKYL
jgi:hypothetical protein